MKFYGLSPRFRRPQRDRGSAGITGFPDPLRTDATNSGFFPRLHDAPLDRRFSLLILRERFPASLLRAASGVRKIRCGVPQSRRSRFESRGSRQFIARKRRASWPSFEGLAYRSGNLLRYTRSHAISGVSNDRYACSADLPHMSDS